MSASHAVQHEWLRRVEAEYRSAALTQHFGHWLIQIAAPPDLITDALRIVGDEMAHAELSHATYVAAGGSQAPAIVRESLALGRSQAPLEHDVLRYAVQIYCLGETVAVRLFERMRRGATQETARIALDRILKDEVRHRDFGWTLLEWLLEQSAAPDYRAALDEQLPGMLRAIRASYGDTPRPNAGEVPVPAGAASVSDDDRAWGLISRAEYVAAMEDTWQRDYVPRFEGLGVGTPER